MKNVRIIPPKPKENKKLRVAAYCRVSTSGPEQMSSFEIQIKTYTKMIKSHPNWIFVGVYYDIESGLRRSGRKSLDKLLKKATKGKIDYIITKSISRVSRDTLGILKMRSWIQLKRIKNSRLHLGVCWRRMRAGIPARIFSGDFNVSSKKVIYLRSIRILWDTLALTVR